jgi:hypothetical protein
MSVDERSWDADGNWQGPRDVRSFLYENRFFAALWWLVATGIALAIFTDVVQWLARAARHPAEPVGGRSCLVRVHVRVRARVDRRRRLITRGNAAAFFSAKSWCLARPTQFAGSNVHWSVETVKGLLRHG